LQFDSKVNDLLFSSNASEKSNPALLKVEIEFFDKIEIDKTGNIETDILNFTNKINLFLEKIISDKPEEWVWVHNRWDKRFN